MPAGRPSLYGVEVAQQICGRLIEGESLRSICRDDAMPCLSTVMLWLTQHAEFSEQYALARERQADTLADEIQEIADDGRNDWMERHGDKDSGWIANGEHINRSRLRVDTRKWIASKLKPKKYGDRLALGGPEGGAIPIAVVGGDLSDADAMKVYAKLVGVSA